MKKLLIIDPQNDFCDIPGAALPVAGAVADMGRLVTFIQSSRLDGITVTLDSHPSVAVERTTFWKNPAGDAPAPFTFVTLEDITSGKLLPRDASLTPKVAAMLQQLAQRGRPGLVVWPVHCVTGTWGHNIYPTLAEQLGQWEFAQQRAVRKVLKGEYPARLAQVCNLAAMSPQDFEATMRATAVNEVWGVGRQTSKGLVAGGIHTVHDLMQLDNAAIRGRWGVVLERTVRELHGIPCVDLDHTPAPRKEIACTRSFGRPVTELSDLNQAVTEFASRAAQKLRKQHSLAAQALVFIRTSPFRPDAQYSRSMVVPLRRPTADTALLVHAALAGLRQIYRSDFKYAKAGVMLIDLQPDAVGQQELDLEGDKTTDRSQLMSAMDAINQRYGKGTMKIASAGVDSKPRVWSMKQERRTPGYTTCWDDLPIAWA